MKPGIDPKVDFAFKFLFGNEHDTRPLINLLHAVLNPAPDEQIVEVQILNPFTVQVDLDDKLSILDIKARDQLGRHFNVEMQILATPSLRQRILFYWAKLYSDQLQRGEDYILLRPTISVCFVDAVMFPSVQEDHVVFRLLDETGRVTLTDYLTIHFFELPKFRLAAEELRTPLDVWLYFLRNAQLLDTERLPGALDTEEIRHAMEVLNMIGETTIQREIYEGRLKRIRDERMYALDAAIALAEANKALAEANKAAEEANKAAEEANKAAEEANKAAEEANKAAEEANKAAEEALARGLAEGRERGREEGREQGQEEGREQGREEGREQGLRSGALIGQIEFFQRRLGREVTSRAELAEMPLAALEALAALLEQEAMA